MELDINKWNKGLKVQVEAAQEALHNTWLNQEQRKKLDSLNRLIGYCKSLDAQSVMGNYK